jgi:hypothetical protein
MSVANLQRAPKPCLPNAQQQNQNLPGAADALVELADDAQQPAIARASAVAMLRDYLGPQTLGTVAAATRDPDPLVRDAAITALRQADPALRVGLLATLLEDPLRTIRIVWFGAEEVGLFGGPLYTIYKTITAIKLAKTLKEKQMPISVFSENQFAQWPMESCSNP